MNKNVRKGVVPYLFLLLLILGLYYSFIVMNTKVHEYSYSELVSYIEKNDVSEIKIIPNSRGGIYKITGKLKGYKENDAE